MPIQAPSLSDTLRGNIKCLDAFLSHLPDQTPPNIVHGIGGVISNLDRIATHLEREQLPSLNVINAELYRVMFYVYMKGFQDKSASFEDALTEALDESVIPPMFDQDEFTALLHLFMCSDPYPCDGQEIVMEMLENEAKARGFNNWEEAYHAM